MSTGISRAVRAARRTGLRGGAVLVGAAILAGGVLASPASAATVPRPAPGFVPGANAQSDTIRIFYQQVNHNLPHGVRPVGVGVGQAAEPGGRAHQRTRGDHHQRWVREIASTWAFARGTGKAVRYREFVGARGSWGP